MKTKLINQLVEIAANPICVPSDDEIEDLVEQNAWIVQLSVVDSLEKFREEKQDYPSSDDVQKLVELRDMIAKLPPEIVCIGQKKIDGLPLTDAERKRIERFRKNPIWKNFMKE